MAPAHSYRAPLGKPSFLGNQAGQWLAVDWVSVVLPTFNRAAALLANLGWLLALEGVGEVIVVDDGSTDTTPQVLAAHDDDRLRVVRLVRNGGSPAARNEGVALARGAWVVFGEDDCRFPPDYASTLRAEAEAGQADVVGAPMVHLRAGAQLEVEVADGRARCLGENGLDEVAGFPPRPVETALLPAPALVRREVFDTITFDEGYRGNAYREETDFFVRAHRSGFRCVLTPDTYFWEAARWGGGQARSRLATEYWTARNNWRFLRRQGPWLVEHGYISSSLGYQAAFMQRRVERLLT